jgi:hypothetical protein
MTKKARTFPSSIPALVNLCRSHHCPKEQLYEIIRHYMYSITSTTEREVATKDYTRLNLHKFPEIKETSTSTRNEQRCSKCIPYYEPHFIPSTLDEYNFDYRPPK